jgi:hypothetical protein
MVFNVKEIKPEHKPLLERVERLIKHELPYRFGILSDDEYNNGQGNEKDPFDDEYKLFYSRYRYGKFFHITTEYVHTMSNISDKAHGYKNSITLEELIYTCGLNSDSGKPFLKPFLEDLKIEYEIREHQINNYGMVQSQINEKRHKNERNENSIKNRSDIVFDLYEKDKEKKNKEKNKEEHKFEVVLRNKELYKTLNNKDIKFILMFKASVQEYTLIYSLNSLFYKLVIESNMKSIIDEILKELDTMVLSNNSNTIKFKNPTKLFKIVSNTILDIEDYKLIFSYNPLVVNKYTKLNIETDLLNSIYYYKTDLLDSIFKDINIYNLYKFTKPILINNYKKYLSNNKITCSNDSVTYPESFEKLKCYLQNCENPIINCVHYDSDNTTGYNIIEVIDNKYNKIVLWILPTYEKPNCKYLSNYLDLDNNSIPILNKILNMYLNNNNFICFAHTTINLMFNCLHFHIVRHNYYLKNYSHNNIGSFVIQDYYLKKLINFLNTNKTYFNTFNIKLIKFY